LNAAALCSLRRLAASRQALKEWLITLLCHGVGDY
jgi:hypothetical protein